MYPSNMTKCPVCGQPSEEFANLPQGKTNLGIKRSGWYTFATVMIILGGIAVLITLLSVIGQSSKDRNWIPFFIVLGGYLMELGFWAIVQLLAGIKQGVDTLQQNSKK